MSAIKTVTVENLDDFVRLLMGWHKQKIAQIKHFIELPEGTEVSDEADQPVTLTGDVRKAFIFGLKTALEHIENLPFEAELEEAPAGVLQGQLDLGEPDTDPHTTH